MNYNKIIGQQNVVRYLEKSLENNKIAHAIIFEGDDGMGKLTLASIYTQALFCTGANKPCDNCSACSKFTSGNHTDFQILEPARNSKTIKTEEISTLLSDAYVIPNEGGRKVYIIQKAHWMTAAAQNKLLKILEEPPLYLTIILLCDNIANILQTIISRSILLKMQKVSDNQLSEFLKNNNIDEQLADHAVKIANGNIGIALDAVENKKFIEQNEEYSATLFGISPDNMINTFSYLEKKRSDIGAILICWQKILSNCLMIKSENNGKQYSKNEINYSRKHSINDIINKLNYIIEAENRFASNAQYLPTIDWLLTKLQQKN